MKSFEKYLEAMWIPKEGGGYRKATPEEEEDIKRKGKRVHFYDVNNILKPRGSMKKESLGEYIFEELMSAWENWIDPKYGDNPSPGELDQIIEMNLMGEVKAALTKFRKDRKKAGKVVNIKSIKRK